MSFLCHFQLICVILFIADEKNKVVLRGTFSSKSLGLCGGRGGATPGSAPDFLKLQPIIHLFWSVNTISLRLVLKTQSVMTLGMSVGRVKLPSSSSLR